MTAASAAWPRAADWVFAAKTFAAAMLALLIGLGADLPRPYWAVATVYIVSQPLSGAMRSKAVYRVLGTVLGAAATVLLVPNLAGAPELLAAALALWTGLCLYLALLDRTPRSYVFMLAGYSAAIIGFPSVGTPDQIFDIAVSRVEEITLGILSAAVVGSVVFPRSLGPVVAARIDAWLADAARWAGDVLQGRDDAAINGDRRRLAADAVETQMMSGQLAYDTARAPGAPQLVRSLHQRMVMMLPLLSGVADRAAALRAQAGGLPATATALLSQVAAWAEAPDRDAAQADRLRAAIARARPVPDGWPALLQAGLLDRLGGLLDLLQDCDGLRRDLASPRMMPADRLRRLEREQAPFHLHRDRGMALLSAAGAVLTIGLCCLFWIASGWPDGAVACQMAAVACSFFAAQDNPVPAILTFTLFNLVGAAVAGLYLFAILPAIDGFPLLVTALAPVFLLIGLGITRPAWSGRALAIGATAPTMMSLQGVYSADFPVFANGALSMAAGMTLAALVTALVRSMGAEVSARRLLRAGWSDLARLAGHRGGPDPGFSIRMIDRLGLLAPRLAAVSPGADVSAADTLADIRIGINVAELRQARRRLAPPARQAADALLAATAEHFRRQAGAARLCRPDPALGATLDALIATLLLQPSAAAEPALLAAAGIRRGLFPDRTGLDLPPVPPPRVERMAA
jgi:uncharacterized membrane protein YccC